MAYEQRILAGMLTVFLGAALAPGCDSATSTVDSDDTERGGKAGSGATGASAGAAARGGVGQGFGGSGATGGSNEGGESSGSGGATGGDAGATAKGGNAGATAKGGNAGASATGGASGAATGGSGGGGMGASSGAGDGGKGGKGGKGEPTVCVPDSDAMDMCGPRGTACLCCPTGAVTQACICTSQCASSADCRDPDLPVCNIDTQFTQMGICAPEGFVCRWGARCAAPNTPIATPQGERPISELRVGDAVYSVDGGAVVVVPIRAVRRVPVTRAHTVSRVTLAGGALLEMSPGHPTADGRLFADLRPGDEVFGVRVELVVPNSAYTYEFTHDILPDSPSGAYFAAGALVGSTLADPF